MRMYDLIYTKKQGGALTPDQIAFWVEGAADGSIPDEQSASLLMAICWRSQVGTHPPRFAAVTNFPEHVAPSYARYLQNQLRERFNFEAVPVRVSFKPKRRREDMA